MSTKDPERPSKIEVMRALLEHAEAQVHLDARRSGVLLPERLRRSSNVRLDYGYGLVPPIPDLLVDEEGIRATLSFNRIPFQTFVPWDAVFLIADFAGRGAVWREDLPPELAVEVIVPQGAEGAPGPMQEPEPEPEPAPVPKRRFTVLDGDSPPPGERTAAPEGSGDDAPPEPPRSRPTLRLVR